MSLRRLALTAAILLCRAATLGAQTRMPDWSGQWVRIGPNTFDPDKPPDEDAYWFACGDEDSNWGSGATARRGKILGYRHREGREAERREAKRAKAQAEEELSPTWTASNG